jgi:hypothetical protein
MQSGTIVIREFSEYRERGLFEFPAFRPQVGATVKD